MKALDSRQNSSPMRFIEPNEESADMGKAGSFRYNILHALLEEKYSDAVDYIKAEIEKESVYPKYHKKVDRIFHHGIDLVSAIRAKRDFPGFKSLVRSKQAELRDKIIKHYRELESMLKKIEEIEDGLKREDQRSTIYVVRSLWFGALVLLLVAFFQEIIGGLAKTGYVFSNNSANELLTYLLEKLGM